MIELDAMKFVNQELEQILEKYALKLHKPNLKA